MMLGRGPSSLCRVRASWHGSRIPKPIHVVGCLLPFPDTLISKLFLSEATLSSEQRGH